jgi:WD40 repeat protein
VLATGGQDLRLWEIPSGRNKSTVPLTASVTALAFLPDDKALVVCLSNGTVRRWSTLKNRFYRSITLREEDPYAHLYPPLTAALSSDRRTLATGRSYIGWEKGGLTPFSSVRLWDTAWGKLKAKLPPTPPIDALSFSRDGKQLATACGMYCDTGTFSRLWSLEGFDPTQLATPPSVHAFAFSPDGLTVAAGGGRYTDTGTVGQIVLSDAETGREKAKLPEHGEMVWALAFAPNGKILASGGNERQQEPQKKPTSSGHGLWTPLGGHGVYDFGEHVSSKSAINPKPFGTGAKPLWDAGSEC